MVKYSIILRAYNAGNHVAKSIESIISQSYSEWELIIVNDGSTDNTGSICEEYAAKDDRIKVFHQNNKGCLLATQTGIENSTGEYICLIDSDDWYSERYLECVDTIACNHDVDMIVTNYYTVEPMQKKSKFSLTKEDFIADNIKAIEIFLKTTNYALWNKVVKKEKINYTIDEKHFFASYGKQANFGDDLYQLMPVLCGCENIYFTSEYLYNYVIDEKSVSHQRVRDQWNDMLKRNRLMGFTYKAIRDRECMNASIKSLIEVNTVKLLLPGMVDVLKYKKIDRNALREFKSDEFYRKVIMRMKYSKMNRKFGKKRAVIFWLFNLMVLCSNHN